MSDKNHIKERMDEILTIVYLSLPRRVWLGEIISMSHDRNLAVRIFGDVLFSSSIEVKTTTKFNFSQILTITFQFVIVGVPWHLLQTDL